MTFDRVARIAVLLVLLAFLYVAWGMKDNGRYVYHPQTADHVLSQLVVDSRTGTVFVFVLERSAFIEFHPQTGERVVHWYWPPVVPSAEAK